MALFKERREAGRRLARKLGLPSHEELAMGAIASDPERTVQEVRY